MAMSLQLTDALVSCGVVDDKDAATLAAAGMHQVQELLMRIPRRYEDRRSSARIEELANGQTASLRVHVYSTGWRFSYKRYFEVAVGHEGEPNGARLYLRWFNMPYIAKLLATGQDLFIYGRAKDYAGKLSMINPDFELMESDAGLNLAARALGDMADGMSEVEGAGANKGDKEQPVQVCIHTSRIVPIYRGLSGLPARRYRELIWRVLQSLAPDAHPDAYDNAPSYPFRQALDDIHVPADEADHRNARMRFALAECFEQQFKVQWKRQRTQGTPGQICATTGYYLKELQEKLPFALTGAQLRCIDEIKADMMRPVQMNRLVQGDVGSGKTLVALAAMLLAVESGKTAALIAPTQILAEQHYNNFKRLLDGMDIRLSLRTSDRKEDVGYVSANPAEADKEPRILVGTHALLYKKSRPQNLGLAVIDEQHKFGVAQREQFIYNSSDVPPDVLVMTATPIPRTLTLTLYGDLDVSIIDELPANRGEIITALRNPKNMKRIIAFMRSELEAGRQIYIVSALIEESDKRAQASALQELERWRAEFPDEPIGLLHGRMSAEEKDAVMAEFRANDLHLLVATTVVEVGVDVPNATIMMINDADSFGLSQLHQLRGRIGRGLHKSYCILLSSTKAGDPGRDKLEVLCRTINGFEIAEEDFRMRGPGDVLGTAQSGLASILFGEWLSDTRLIHRASKDAAEVLAKDPHLRLPEHAPLLRLIAGEMEQAVVG